ncbi:ABC transporter substrate-binding protein [Patescibacteria group bacterium]|nr:ABC transporter substrate-binding protein [Patescibacteria group bacterium]MCG2695114.1 ABC transporter substrate-binding protein [Candidatus Parcubacteria bacterium]
MNNTTKWIIGIIIVVAIIWFGFLKKSGEPTSNEPIKIGFVSSLSGEASTWGEPLKSGFDFAIDEINKNGGIKGRLIEPFYEDDACEAKTGVSAFSKLIDINKVKIITGTVCSSVAMSVSPKTQENRVLYIATGATDPEVVKQGDLIFRMWVSDSYEAEEVGKYAVKELNLKNMAIVYVNDNPAGASLKDNFKSVVESGGGKIIGTEGVSSKENDFRTVFTKLMSSEFDGIYIMVMPDQMATAINQLRELNYKGVVFAYAPSIYAEGVASKLKNKDNIYYAIPVEKRETNFWSDYKNTKGKEADLLVALGYDSGKIIIDGLNQCGEDNECIKNYILSLKNYQTVRGLLSFDKDGDVTGVDFEIKQP